MPTLRRIADKTKAFFERLTRRSRSRNRNQHSTRYREGESGKGSASYTRDEGVEPSLTILGGGTTNVIHTSARDSDTAHAFDASAHYGLNVVRGPPPLPSVVASPHPTFDPSAAPPIPSIQGGLHDPPFTPPALLFDAKLNAHGLHNPIQKPSSLSSSPSLSVTPMQSLLAPYSAPNYFSNANGFSIGQVYTGDVHNFGSLRTVFEHLEPHISHGAAHNSNERFDAPACAPETRRAVQDDIVSWMRGGDRDGDPKQIMWLSGPAGSGKTAIAGSVAETCRTECLLAATFFFSSFSGLADRHAKRCVVATLARHLAGHHALHQYKVQLLASLERQPDIFHKRLSEQAQYLLIEPFRALQEQEDRATWPKGIILDGIDEVLAEKRPNQISEDLERAHEEDQLEILHVLVTLAKDPIFPFRIFVASRPERVISNFFSTTAQATTLTLFLDSKYEPDADIERFLWSRFAEIRRRYGISNASWPGQEAVNRMVEMSSGQFIVPATIVRHIEAGVPQRQLDDILQLKWQDAGRRNPFAVVDALYTCILRRSPDPFLAARWLHVHTSATETIPALYFKQIFEDVEGEFHHILGPLSSLISIPTADDKETPLKIYHKSLSDFLSSQHRSADLYLDESSVAALVGERCVNVLRSKGPTVPVQDSPDDIGAFLDVFYLSALVNLLYVEGYGGLQEISTAKSPRTAASHRLGEFLISLSENLRVELARCDVAWWTRLCLAHLPYKTERFGMSFIGGMYCGIHTHICSSSSRSTSTTCHAACSHWRAGILAEAKALNWCVHELEQTNLGKLSKVTHAHFNDRFKRMGKRANGSSLSCAICQPNFNTSLLE